MSLLKKIPKKIKIIEGGPRDGLQNENGLVSTSDKVVYIKKLVDAGLRTIEVTSFVNNEKIPQMADAEDLYKLVLKNEFPKGLSFPCLVPNITGLEKALKAITAKRAMTIKNNIRYTISMALL